MAILQWKVNGRRYHALSVQHVGVQCLGWGRGGIIGNGSLPWPVRTADVRRTA